MKKVSKGKSVEPTSQGWRGSLKKPGGQLRESLVAENSPLALPGTGVDMIGDSASCLESERSSMPKKY